MGSVITLTTDFGLADSYVAAMKAVILVINPEARLVDISHAIQPQNVRQAAFVLGSVYSYFPSQTVHLIVVDPGVGTDRRAIILKTPRAFFVAPDNGVLTYVIDASSERVPRSQLVKLGPDLKAYVLTKREYWIQPVSNIFHGRDIFAPVAARLSLGMPPASLGENVDSITAFPVPRPLNEGGRVTGEVIHIDSFGNLITNIQASLLPPADQPANITIAKQTIRGISRTYAGRSDLTALVGSSGYLEIALPGGSAADLFQIQMGEPVTVKQKEQA